MIGKYYAVPRAPSMEQLPIDPPNFTGRDREIAQITDRLRQPGQVVGIFAMSGMGGVGKSALAIHVAHQLKLQYPDGQLWLDLRGQSESPLTLEDALRKILVEGFGDEPGHLPVDLDGLQTRYRSRFAGRRVLLVLDNARDGLQVQGLLPGAAGCGVLLTSRERLQLRELSPEQAVPIGVLSPEEALTLLGKIGGEANGDAARELVRLCGYLPLAIQVVGALLQEPETTVAGLVAELADEKSRLAKLRVLTPEGKVWVDLDVAASLSLSYRRLGALEQRVLARVAVLRGADFGVELAAVLGELDAAAMQLVLRQLCRFQLLMQDSGRYAFHDLVRLFARGELDGETQQALAVQALGWYDDNADAFDNYLDPTRRRPIAKGFVSEWKQPLEIIEEMLEQAGLAWFGRERANLVDAVAWARNLGEHQTAVQLTGTLAPFFQQQSRWIDLVTTHKVALESAEEIGANYGIAQIMGNLGVVYKGQGKWNDAIDCYQKSLELFREIGDNQSVATTVNNLGNAYKAQGKWDAAIDCYQKALQIFREIGDNQNIASTTGNFGAVYQAQDKWDDAIVCYQKALQTFHEIGDNYGIAKAMGNLGNIYQVQNKWDDAIVCYQKALQTFHKIGDNQSISQTIMGLGLVYESQGKWAEAIDCHQKALETMQLIGDNHGIIKTMGNLGNVYQAQGKWDMAIDCHQKTIQGAHQLGDPHTEATGWFNLGNAQAKLSNLNARSSYQTAKTLFQQLKLTSKVEICDNEIAQIGQLARPELRLKAPTIGEPQPPIVKTPPKPKPTEPFPLWQTAVVLLLSYGLFTTLTAPPPPIPPTPQTQPK